MKKGKSVFNFVVNADEMSIHNLMQSFLSANGFVAKQETGYTYYMQQDFMWGNRFLEYYVNGNQVTVLAYIGKANKPLMLDNSFAGSMPKQEYKKLLNTLFSALNELNANAGQMGAQNVGAQNMGAAGDAYSGQQAYGQPQQGQSVDISQQTNQFAQNVNKSKENMAIAGFVISIIGLVLSCFGYMVGAVIIALEIYFAVNGLKTSKRGLSIATFVICGVSILILIFQVIALFVMA